MSDYGDFCREQRQHKQKVRAKNAVDNERFVGGMATLGFSRSAMGAGYRFSRVMPGDGVKLLRIDFWPSTGKWNVVGTGDYRVGGRKMLDEAKRLIKAEPEPAPVEKPKPKWTGNPSGPNEPPWDDCPCPLCKEK